MIRYFVDSVNEAIDKYQDLFIEKDMSRKRAQDIVDLQEILETQSTRSFNSLKDAVETRIGQMKTGWWIFRTGRSRLKNYIKHVISNYDQPSIKVLIRTVTEIRDSVDEQQGRSAPISIPGTQVDSVRVEALEGSLRASLDENAILRDRLRESEAENASLRSECSEAANIDDIEECFGEALRFGRG